MTRQFEGALSLARTGYRVFPCHGIDSRGRCTCGNPGCENPGKHPAFRGWKKKATNDLDQVRRWWEYNSAFNPGVATGGSLLVLDVDGEEGRKNLRELEKQYGSLPPTQIVLTGRKDGGEHRYFQNPFGKIFKNSVGEIAEHLDIRTDGGYVIGPGARHVSGNYYAWKDGCSPDDIEEARLPEWIPQCLAVRKPETHQEFRNEDGTIPEGERNATLFHYGCMLRGQKGKSMKEIEKILYEVNQNRCTPPLDDYEINQIINSIDQYPRNGDAEKEFSDDVPAELICAADVPDEDTRFILEPYIPEGQLTLIQGNPGDGKTALACKFAALVSTGANLIDLPCVQGNVLMLSVEDDMTVLKKRIKASGGDLNHCFFAPDASQLQFTSSRIERYIQEKSIKLVVFDPIQAFLGAKVDMNRANETRPVLAKLKEMARRNECGAIIISHVNKGGKDGLAIQRALGSMDIPGACRSVIHVGRLDNDNQKRLAVHVKSSNAREGQSILYHIVKDGGVEIDGFTEKGYENLSELNRKTRKAASDPFMVEIVSDACKKLLKENPSGLKVRYKDMGIAWPTGVYPGKLIDSIRNELEDRGLRVETGKKYNGGSAVMITKAPGLFEDNPAVSE